MEKSKRLIVANWKMNPETHTEASKLFGGIKKTASTLRNVQTVICPPFVFLDKVAQEYAGHRILFGGQDIGIPEGGAHTGEVSGRQLYSVGADYCIVGHSERRADGETDEQVAAKIERALLSELTPIVCIGESKRDHAGHYLTFLRNQIGQAFKQIKSKDIPNVVIAYEPIWAIGKTGRDAITPQKLHETVLYIRRVLRENYGGAIENQMTILYGGSVKAANAEELLRDGEVQGFLVGGASLRIDEFSSILETANK